MTRTKSRYFQVYNHSTDRWVKYDREEGRIVDAKKEKGAYVGIPKYRQSKTIKGE